MKARPGGISSSPIALNGRLFGIRFGEWASWWTLDVVTLIGLDNCTSVACSGTHIIGPVSFSGELNSCGLIIVRNIYFGVDTMYALISQFHSILNHRAFSSQT